MTLEVRFDKIVSEGKGMAHVDGKALFVAGVLPGELARVRITKRKPTWMEGVLEEVLERSPHRHEPLESHYASCSPWQNVDYAYQLELKRQVLTEQFNHPELGLPIADFIGAPQATAYRNKLEYTLETDPYGVLQLSFHQRGSFTELVPAPDGCVLGTVAMNQLAVTLLDKLRTLDLADFADTLTIRESQLTGDMVAVLQLKKRLKRDWQLLMLGGKLTGLVVVLKDSHDSYTTVWSRGELNLTATVAGLNFSYPWDGFFQVNLPVFEVALAQIGAAVLPKSRVIDLYGGVGSIGLTLARTAKSVIGIDIVASSVEQANANARANKITNYRAEAIASEKMDPAALASADVVVLDPPRGGLHPRVVDYLLDASPAKIIYLSCNPVTQVRDLRLFKAGGYNVGSPIGFDFYPGTLHLESLVILDRAA